LRYTRDIDLEDTNNAHSLAILSVPPGGRVLDIGPGGDHVVSALRERGCTVWAVEIDGEAARAAEPYCERVLVADVETVDLGREFEGLRFDCILFLDVLEHLREPLPVLRDAAKLLADEASVVASIPNVTHAALRLELLRGRFRYRDTGLLDRTHLRFFDQEGVNELFRQAGLRIEEQLRVSRGITETELEIDPSDYPEEAVRLATADPEALTYQFIVVARPGHENSLPHEMTLLERLQHERDELQRQLQEASKWIESELARAQDDMVALRRDIAIKEAYIAELRMNVRDVRPAIMRARLNLERHLYDTAIRHPALAKAKPLYLGVQRALLWLERAFKVASRHRL
jgi:2-polyprenyl-3-methyl-5-hydroxy-6-metoxy-1,4-benzoquinol methylase